jgi:hypothetical protein
VDGGDGGVGPDDGAPHARGADIDDEDRLAHPGESAPSEARTTHGCPRGQSRRDGRATRSLPDCAHGHRPESRAPAAVRRTAGRTARTATA